MLDIMWSVVSRRRLGCNSVPYKRCAMVCALCVREETDFYRLKRRENKAFCP